MDKFYQACYTRLGGADHNAGWQLTNSSPDIPGRLLRFFEQRQKGNAPVGRNTPHNVKGEHLCALEIGCEGDAFGITRIQYGVPCHGREGLYSHGFFIPDAYELLKDPNRLLALSGENFCFRGERPAPEEELDVYQKRTAEIPQTLSYEEGWDVERALERTGMNNQSYRTYLYCLYSSWAKSAKTTFYVKTDGTEEMAKAMLYLAYVALPYSMRSKLSASTFLDAKDVTMVLSHERPDSCRWFDPGNGMENMLSDIQRRRWERMPVVAMAFEEEGCGFDQLEEKLELMGDRGSQDIDMLNLAYKLCRGDEMDSVDMLYDFLELPLNFNETMEIMVGDVLHDVIRRVENENLGVSNDMEEMLIQRQRSSCSEEFKDTIRTYRSIRFQKKDVPEACDDLEKDEEFFQEMRPILVKKNSAVLLEYYRRGLQKTIDEPDCTYEKLTNCAAGFQDLENMGILWDLLCEKAKAMAAEQTEEALQKMLKGEALVGEHTPLYLALDAYVGFCKKLKELLETVPQGEEIMAGMRNDYSSSLSKYIKMYDRDFRLHFNAARIREYEVFYTKDFPKIETLRFNRELLRIYLEAERGDLGLLLNYVNRKPSDVTCTEWDVIKKSLFEYWINSEAVRKNLWIKAEADALRDNPNEENIRKFAEKDTWTLIFWRKAAELKNRKTIALMLDQESAIVCIKGKLEMSLEYNRTYWAERMIRTWLYECNVSINIGNQGAKPIQILLQRKLEEITMPAEPEELTYVAREEGTARERKNAEKKAALEREKAERQAAKKRDYAAAKGIVELESGEQPQISNGIPGGHMSWNDSKNQPPNVDEIDSVMDVIQHGRDSLNQNKGAHVAPTKKRDSPAEPEKKGLRGKIPFLNRRKR